jgi:hypothetical protein
VGVIISLTVRIRDAQSFVNGVSTGAVHSNQPSQSPTLPAQAIVRDFERIAQNWPVQGTASPSLGYYPRSVQSRSGTYPSNGTSAPPSPFSSCNVLQRASHPPLPLLYQEGELTAVPGLHPKQRRELQQHPVGHWPEDSTNEYRIRGGFNETFHSMPGWQAWSPPNPFTASRSPPYTSVDISLQGIPTDHLSTVGHGFSTREAPSTTRLPCTMSHPLDSSMLSDHQVYLRQQIEVFAASCADVHTPVRGRNNRILLDQVGIRCRHCAHLPIQQRQLGSVYFPAATMGFYQAAQNMLSTHIQCGKCNVLPDSVTREFHRLLTLKKCSSLGGRRYWAERIRELGLLDTDCGVFLVGHVPLSAKIQLAIDNRASPKRKLGR